MADPNRLQFFNVSTGLEPKEGPRVFPFQFDFSGAILSEFIDLELAFATKQVSIIQTVFINNVNGSQPLTVAFDVTGMTVTCPAFGQGYFPVLVVAPTRMIVSVPRATSTNVVRVTLMNTKMTPGFWGADDGMPSIVAGSNTGTAAFTRLFPAWRATRSLQGAITATGLTTVLAVPANEIFYMTSINLSLSGNAALAAPGELTIQVRSGTGNFMRWDVYLTGVAQNGVISLVDLSDLGIISFNVGDDLNINLSAALTAGRLNYSIGCGLSQPY